MIEQVDHVNVVVEDLAAMTSFYCDVLGLTAAQTSGVAETRESPRLPKSFHPPIRRLLPRPLRVQPVGIVRAGQGDLLIAASCVKWYSAMVNSALVSSPD